MASKSAILLMIVSSVLLARVDIESMEDSTVRVLHDAGKGMGTGSGFVVGQGRHVVTNLHVVSQGGKTGKIVVAISQEKMLPAKLIWKSAVKDLAVLEVSGSMGKTPARFASRETVSKAQTVYVLGFPGAADRGLESMFEIKATRGIISSFITLESGAAAYQIDAAVNPGNSGGPLFTECGEVIGVNTLKSLTLVDTVDARGKKIRNRVPLGEGIAWSIQVEEVAEVLAELDLPVDMSKQPCSTEAPVQAQTSPILWVLTFGFLFLCLVMVFKLRSQDRRKKAYQTMTNMMALGRGGQRPAPSAPPAPAPVQTAPSPPPPPVAPAPRLAVIRCVVGELVGQQAQLGPHPTVIGRDPSAAQLVFNTTPSISKRHCQVHFDARLGTVVLQDLGSANGTLYGQNQRLAANQAVQLSSGNRFQLSGSHTVFEVSIQ